MKTQSKEQICADHHWQPLFDKPNGAEHVREYLAYGYADWRQCSKCGAVGMAENSTSRKVYLLGDSWANSKQRHAVLWNARQAEADNQALHEDSLKAT